MIHKNVNEPEWYNNDIRNQPQWTTWFTINLSEPKWYMYTQKLSGPLYDAILNHNDILYQRRTPRFFFSIRYTAFNKAVKHIYIETRVFVINTHSIYFPLIVAADGVDFFFLNSLNEYMVFQMNYTSLHNAEIAFCMVLRNQRL